MIDLRATKDQASALIAKNKFEPALELLKKALAADPRDVSARQKAAEVLAKLKRPADAVREYQQVVGLYASQGHLLKAAAVCKVILQLDPKHQETQKALAELYAQRAGTPAVGSPAAAPTSGSGTFAQVVSQRAGTGAFSAAKPATGLHFAAAPGGARAIDPVELPDDTGEMILDNTRFDGDGNRVAAVLPSSVPPATVVAPTGRQPPPPPPSSGVSATAAHRAVAASTQSAPVVRRPPAPPPILSAEDMMVEEEVLEGAVLEEDPVLLVPPPAPPAPPRRVVVQPANPSQAEVAGLPKVPLFSDLSMEAFKLVLEEVEMESYGPGEAIVREGEVGDAMYSIVQGEVRVLRMQPGGEPREVARMHDSDFFGEMALATDGPRLATVEAVTPTIVLVFSRDKLESVIRAHPSVQSAIGRFYRERLLANLLRSNQLFQPLSDEDKAALSLAFQARGARKGTLILKQGQKPDAFFLLLRGRLNVTHESESGPVPYPDLHEGDIFGELSLIQNAPVSATIRAATACVVLRLPQQVFMERLVANPAVREIIRPLLTERIQRTAQLNAPLDFETPFQV